MLMISQAWRQATVTVSMLWVATATGAGMVFLTQALLARQLGPASYGLFASSLATVAIIAPLAGFGLSQFRLKAYGAEGWAADRWNLPSLRFIGVTLSLAMILVFVWAWLVASESSTRFTLLVLSPVIIGVLAIDLIGSKLRLEENYHRLALWHLVVPTVRFALVAALLLAAALTVRSITFGYCAISLGVAIAAAPQVRAVLKGRMELRGHGPREESARSMPQPTAKELWSQAWVYGVAAVLYPVFFQVSTVLLKYMNGDAQAGRYGIALAVMTAIYLLPATLYQKFLLSKLHRWAVHDKPKFWRVYRIGNKAMLLCGLLVSVAMLLLAPWVVPLAFGQEYQGVVSILMVLALCPPIRFLSTSVGSILLTESHMRYRVRAMASATIAAIVLNAILIPRFNEIGAASATVLAEVVLLLAIYRGTRLCRPQI